MPRAWVLGKGRVMLGPRPRRKPALTLLAVSVAATLVLTACTGPRQDLDVDVRSQHARLPLSAAQQMAHAVPIPPYVGAGGRSGDSPPGWVVNPKLAQTPLPSPTGSRECPFTDPRQNVVAALDAPVAPPAPARYAYFSQGLYEAVSEDGGRNAVMPATTHREVHDVVWGPGKTYFDFSMTVEAPQGRTTTRYRVVLDDPEVARPDVPRPVNVREPPPPFLAPSTEPPIVGTVRVGTPAQPGMYVLSIQADDGPPMEFNGGAGMLMVRWPAMPGDTVQAQATVGDMHLAYTSTVLDKGQVEACGELLDARAVRLSGTVTSARYQAPATFDATYHIATQFGGLVIADSRTTTVGSDASSSVTETVTARIKGAPRPAAPQPPTPACAQAAAGAPVLPAGPGIDTPPVEGSYRLRTPPVDYTVSTYRVSGIQPDAGKLPTTLIRTIQNVSWEADRRSFTYETRDNLGGSITTTRYRVIPLADDSAEPPPAKPTAGSPGMYLVSVRYPDGEQVTYNDGAGILLVPFPVQPAPDDESYTMTGNDGRTPVVASIDVLPNEVATACGVRAESWRVDVRIEPGTVPGPKPTPYQYVDTRLLPPTEPPLPTETPKPTAPPAPPGPKEGPRSGLVLLRPYTDLLHDAGHVKVSYAFTIAPGLGGLIMSSRSTVSSVDREDEFQQNLVYTMASKPKVPTP